MTLTEAQRRVLVELSDGSWSDDRTPFAGRVSGNVLSPLQHAGYIRCAFSVGPLTERNWTITQAGLDALEAST